MNAVSPLNSALAGNGLAYLPIFLGIRARTALLIGGGEAALAKLTLLRQAGAQVRLVSEQLDQVTGDAAAGDEMVSVMQEPLTAHHFQDVVLAIDASGDALINRMSVRLARQAGVPINVVDRPALCDFILPSILDRSPVIVAVSTGGLAPAIARLIRQRLELAIPAGFGRVAALAARLRHIVRERLHCGIQRSRFWEDLFDGPAADLAIAGHMDGAVAAASALIEQGARLPSKAEEIYRLHIGSGDPDLLTVRAARLIRMADVIVHDAAVDSAILELARREALKIATDCQRDVGPLETLARSGRMIVCLRANK